MGDIVKFRPRRGGRPASRKHHKSKERSGGRRGRGFLAWWGLMVAAFVLLVPAALLNLFSPLIDALPGAWREGARFTIGQAARWTANWRWNAPSRTPSVNASVIRGRAEAIDGDSLRLRGVEVRLHGIDAPEYRQTCRDSAGRNYACGKRAAAHLRKLLRGREITCHRVTTDRYNRMVARCATADGEDIGQRMVRDGWAVAFVRYSRAYVSDERAARLARRGIWRGRFVPPALWRQANRH